MVADIDVTVRINASLLLIVSDITLSLGDGDGGRALTVLEVLPGPCGRTVSSANVDATGGFRYTVDLEGTRCRCLSEVSVVVAMSS